MRNSWNHKESWGKGKSLRVQDGLSGEADKSHGLDIKDLRFKSIASHEYDMR